MRAFSIQSRRNTSLKFRVELAFLCSIKSPEFLVCSCLHWCGKFLILSPSNKKYTKWYSSQLFVSLFLASIFKNGYVSIYNGSSKNVHTPKVHRIHGIPDVPIYHLGSAIVYKSHLLLAWMCNFFSSVTICMLIALIPSFYSTEKLNLSLLTLSTTVMWVRCFYHPEESSQNTCDFS